MFCRGLGRVALVAALLTCVAGCQTHRQSGDGDIFLDPSDWGTKVENVPFFPQERFQCGPAALATVLKFHGVAITPDDLESELYVPEQRGSHKVSLVAAARDRGFFPYRLTPNFTSIIAELKANRPVIVLQNLGLSWVPKWHFAVVFGYDPEREQVLLRSGTERVRRTAIKTFDRTWQRSGGWALVLLSQDTELPAHADPNEYLYQAAQLEALGMYKRAALRYQTAIQYWPEQAAGWIGLSNVRYRERQLGKAAKLLQTLLEVQPENLTALNNLAQTSMELGHTDQAESLITKAVSGCVTDTPICMQIRSTCKEILAQRCPH